MELELAIAACRLLLWVLLLGGVAPRVMFQDDATDTMAAACRALVVMALVATVLWFCGTLHLGTFLAGIGLYVAGVSRARGRLDHKAFVRRGWLWVTALVHRADQVRWDIAAPEDDGKKKDKKKDESEEATETPHPVLQRLSEARRMLADVARTQAPLWKERARAATMASATAIGRRLDPMQTATLGFACCVAVYLVVLRASSPAVLSASEVSWLLQREGWGGTGAWPGDLVLGELAEQIVQLPPVVASATVGAPLLLIAAWAGQRLLPHLSPGRNDWVGAAALGAPVATLLYRDYDSTVALLIGPALAWAVVSARVEGLKGGLPWLLPLLATFVHPLAGVVCVACVLAAVIARRTAGKLEQSARLMRAIVLAVAAGATLWWTSGQQAPPDGSLPDGLGALPLTFGIAAAITGTYLLLGGVRSVDPAQRHGGRALAVCTLLAVLVEGGFDGQVRGYLGPGVAICLCALCVAVLGSDLQGSHPKWRPAWLAAACILYLASQVRVPEVHTGLVEPYARFAAQLRSRHSPWTYSVIAPDTMFPPFVGQTWAVNLKEAPSLFPAHSYRFDPSHPETMLGTKDTYVVIPVEGELATAGQRWLDTVAEHGEPRVERVQALDSAHADVWRIVRDAKYEARVAQDAWDRAHSSREGGARDRRLTIAPGEAGPVARINKGLRAAVGLANE